MTRRKLADTRTIVTGASSGIGRQIVIQLSRRGGHSIAVARRKDKLEAIVEDLRSDPRCRGSVQILAGDVTAEETRHAAVAYAVEHFGGLDGVINNAGIGAFGRFAENDPARLREIMDVNFFAAAEMTRVAVAELRQSRQPFVVNMNSILGHRAIPQMSEYCASKFALRGFSESLRVEVARLGINLLVVSPGTTETDFYDHVVAGKGKAPWSRGYAVSAESVAAATIRAIERGRREIYPNFGGRLLVLANKFFPGLIDRSLSKYA